MDLTELRRLLPSSLGCPLPIDEHAVSVSLPRWSDVIGYEEGDKIVLETMKIGYPRFKIHAAVEALCDFIASQSSQRAVKTRRMISRSHTDYSWAVTSEIINLSFCSSSSRQERIPCGHTLFSWRPSSADRTCMIFPSKAVALRMKAFMEYESHTSKSHQILELIPIGFQDLFAVVFSNDSSAKAKAKSFWQHTGEIISSRQAEAALKALGLCIPSITCAFCADGLRHALSDEPTTSLCPSLDALESIRRRISVIVEEPVEQVVVTVSGMAAIFAALRLVRSLEEKKGLTGRKIVVFGFPYIDTLKLIERQELNEAGAIFYGDGDNKDLLQLEELLETKRESIAAVFTEFPSNPLLKCPNLARITSLARKFDFLVVVDDTVANFLNVDLLHSPEVTADILCSSLTKSFSGRGDVMAGSLVVNSSSPHSEVLLSLLPSLELPPLFPLDAQILDINSQTFVTRSAQINATALQLAQWFASIPEHIVKVWYPGLQGKPCFDKVSRKSNPQAGYGCLISIILAADIDPRIFYDSLDLCKGPSLGTSFTLVCPYTLLAHYRELPWAASFGVASHLIRISVGLESIEVDMKLFTLV